MTISFYKDELQVEVIVKDFRNGFTHHHALHLNRKDAESPELEEMVAEKLKTLYEDTNETVTKVLRGISS